MNYEREADILYLAHQLWEEIGEADTTPQSCWAQAALQVLARPSRIERQAICTTPIVRQQRYAQSGIGICIDPGTGATQTGVTLIRRSDCSGVANRPVRRLGGVSD